MRTDGWRVVLFATPVLGSEFVGVRKRTHKGFSVEFASSVPTPSHRLVSPAFFGVLCGTFSPACCIGFFECLFFGFAVTDAVLVTVKGLGQEYVGPQAAVRPCCMMFGWLRHQSSYADSEGLARSTRTISPPTFPLAPPVPPVYTRAH